MRVKSSAPLIRELQTSTQVITYHLTFANRKSIGITVRPNLRVDVRAPYGLEPGAVDAALQKRSAWIMRHLEKFAQRPPRQQVSFAANATSYPFLGRQIPLKITPLPPTAADRESINLEHGDLHLRVKHVDDTKRIDARLEAWSRKQAYAIFKERITALLPSFNGQIREAPPLKVRRMKSRWGSCSSSGSITLNLRLVHLDESLIDYVVMHELCHLIEHNHSKRFYALLTRVMPDWRERRARLNETGMPQ
jgi:predicted metal-dependent hydrolase